jgi:hypothetical protein
MKKMIVFLILILLLVSCSKKEKVDEKFTEFTHQIDEDMQEIFGKKEAVKDSMPEVKEKKEVEKVEAEPVVAMTETATEAEAIPVEPEKEIVPEQPEIKPEPKKEPEKTSDLTTTELWDAYRSAKSELEAAQEQNQFEKIIESLFKTTRYAKELKRNDIAAWQLNNIGYYSIEEFKARTEYDTRMNRLNNMPAGDEKRKYYLETKEKINAEYQILQRALPYLQEAETIDKELEDEKRTKIIKNNILFITHISNSYVD